MFHLKCFIDGELHKEIEINPGQEIIIGRDETADIKLDAYPGISREHVKVIHLGDKLFVERISQAGKLVVNGLSEKSIELTGQGQFSIPPYNFETLQNIEDPALIPSENTIEDNVVLEERTFPGDFEKTSISSPDLTASFKRLEFGNIVDEFLMDSAKWTFGRAKTCNVFIEHDKASRQHFEVYKINDKFFIKDLGSSNGTFLNGHQLPANNEIDLKSGDIISIHDYKLVFEIKDNFVEKQIKNLPDFYKPIDLGHIANAPLESNIGVKKVKENWANFSQWSKEKKIRVGAVVAFIFLAIGISLMPSGSNRSLAKLEEAARQQRAEEEKIIENAKSAALQYMDQANWSHCLSEVQRIQDIRPDDPEATEIGLRCQTSMEKLERQNQIEAQEKDRLAVIEKVQLIIDECRPKVNEGGAAVRDCLQPAIELSPENEEIAKLFDLADSVDRLAEEEKSKKEKYLKNLNAGLYLLKQADKFKDKQYWDEAIKYYNSFLKGGYPDPRNENKLRAKRELASIKSALVSTLKRATDDAKIHFSRENYKEAVLAARKGLKIDESHVELKKIESEAISLLRTEIRSLYQDSILMEDLGKIHTAISKWKQIIERDIPGEDYFQKAEGKLKNYETEI